MESNCNSIHIDLTKVEEKHWAYRAIKEALEDGKTSVEIDSGELIDFLKRARATFGIHVTDIGESIRHFFISTTLIPMKISCAVFAQQSCRSISKYTFTVLNTVFI